ncbi:MAG TPA: hypothetical protein VMN60_06345 [Longimicrobiales bacterium]|nr:hypothetical protein [Longimicrobiales bacterium]
MKRALGFAALMAMLPGQALAQHGEVQLGAVTSYGAPASLRLGVGVIAGVAVGRLLYVGMRGVHHAGTTRAVAGAAASNLRDNSQLLLADIGLMMPVGPLEVVPGIALGAMRFNQRASETTHATKFVVATGLSVQARVAGLVVVPEVQYYAARNPRLAFPAPHRGAVAAVRVVFPFEVRRIRY